MPTPAPSPVASSAADLALALAYRAWIVDPSREAPASFRAKFAPTDRARLESVWDATSSITPEAARQALLRDHAASARFDPSRVHPTWFDRIMAAESPAVRALVARSASGSIPRSAPVEWALGLWTERLVGDVAPSAADPLVIVALAELSMLDLARLVRVAGLIKSAFARAGSGAGPSDDDPARTNSVIRVRLGYFRRIIGRPDPRLIPQARADRASVRANPRRIDAAVGLITVGRLLRACEPRRARWASQHLPYPIARQINALVRSDDPGATTLTPRLLQAWETWVFEAARARLVTEGRLKPPAARAKP